MSEQSQGTWLTQEAYDRLAAELEHRKTTERKEIAQRVEAARQEGDLRENAGYHAAREEAGLNEARIIQLEETLENAQIGEAADDGSVSAGTIRFSRECRLCPSTPKAFGIEGPVISASRIPTR